MEKTLPVLFVVLLFGEWARRVLAAVRSGSRRAILFNLAFGGLAFGLCAYWILKRSFG